MEFYWLNSNDVLFKCFWGNLFFWLMYMFLMNKKGIFFFKNYIIVFMKELILKCLVYIWLYIWNKIEEICLIININFIKFIIFIEIEGWFIKYCNYVIISII